MSSVSDELEKRVICLHHLFKSSIAIRKEGYGICSICKDDEKNKGCRGYYPIFLYVYHVDREP